MKQRLKSKNLPFDVREVPGVAVWQIFVTDPNGVMLELNYEMANQRFDAVCVFAGSLYVSG